MRSRLPLTARPAAVLAFCSALVACDDAGEPALDGLSFDVAAPGPFAVGYRDTEISYPAPDGSGPRTIPVSVWYPVSAKAAAAFETGLRPVYLYVESEVALVDAPPAKPAFEGGYPVLVHSHGHGGYPEQSYPTFEWLAANGFLVVAPGHVGDQIGDLSKPTYREYYASHYERAYDVREALDYLEELPAGDPLRGRANTTRALLSGHSRGTYTVWAALGAMTDLVQSDADCSAGDYDDAGGCPAAQRAVYAAGLADARFVGGIPMAGSGDRSWFGGFTGMNAVTAPILAMSGSADPVEADQVFAQVTTPPMIWIDYEGGCHNAFGALGSCGGTVDVVDAQRTFGTYVTAFGRAHLVDDADPSVAAILGGSRVVSSKVTFHGR